MTEATAANDEFTAFWNNVLVAKFERFRNIRHQRDGKVFMRSGSWAITARKPAA